MAVEERAVQEKQMITSMIDTLANNAAKALEEFRCFNQEMIDEIVKQMALTALQNHKNLAKLAVNETRRGVYEDKVFKNMFSTEFIYNNIRDMKTVGVISETYEVFEGGHVSLALTGKFAIFADKWLSSRSQEI